MRIEKKNFLKTIPTLSSFIIILFYTTIPSPLGLALNTPVVPLICFTCWTLIIKSNMTTSQAFLVGLFTDFCMGSGLGSHSLLFIICYLLSRLIYLRFDLNNIYKNFAAALTIILFYFFINTLFIYIYYEHFQSLKFFLFKFLVTITVYPCFYVLLMWLFRLSKLDKVYAEA